MKLFSSGKILHLLSHQTVNHLKALNTKQIIWMYLKSCEIFLKESFKKLEMCTLGCQRFKGNTSESSNVRHGDFRRMCQSWEKFTIHQINRSLKRTPGLKEKKLVPNLHFKMPQSFCLRQFWDICNLRHEIHFEQLSFGRKS